MTFTVLLHFNYTWNISEELFNALEHKFWRRVRLNPPPNTDLQHLHSTFAVLLAHIQS